MNNTYSKLRLVIAAAVVAFIFMLSFSQASAAETRFRVTITSASKSSSGIDKRLAHLKRHLGQLRYNSFKYVSSYSFSLQPSSTREFKITSGVKGKIKLKWVKNNRAAFNFEMPKAAVDISYSISVGGAPTMIVCPKLKGVNYVIIIQALR
jgi:hypothetical protein